MSFSNKFTFLNQLFYLNGTEGALTSEKNKRNWEQPAKI